MNIITKSLLAIDNYQQSRKPLAFIFAVVKKYGDDQAGYQAALVTYYGFLSLFPMLLILTAVAGIIGERDPELAREIVSSVTNYFPVIGKTLQDSVDSKATSGLALVAAVLFSIYGARGGADAFRHAVNHIWHVPLAKRSGFPRSLLRSFGLILGGGTGFIAAYLVAGWAATAGPSGVGRGLSVIVNVAILYLVFMFILRLCLPLSIARRKFRVGAIICAVGLSLLQLAGTLILQNITPSSYSALFATTLGLLAWIYLQAQVVMYAVVVDTVRDTGLLPRSLSGKKLTAADKKIAKRASI